MNIVNATVKLIISIDMAVLLTNLITHRKGQGNNLWTRVL
jgi:hypothetical protein